MAAATDRSSEEAIAVDAARKLSSCVALLSRTVGRGLAQWEMTWPQAVSLLILRAHAEPMNATRLVEELGLGRTAMTAVVDRLERRGWVERRPHPKDRRVALLELTPSGRQVTDEMMEAVRAICAAHVGKARIGTRFDTVTEKVIARLR
jgi:DNA-binding MarR family transcriptional regulator